MQEEAPQEGQQTVPVPGENTWAFYTTGGSGNRCSLAIQQHLLRSPCVCRLCPGAKLSVQSQCSASSQEQLWAITSGVQVVAVAVPGTHLDALWVQQDAQQLSHSILRNFRTLFFWE